MIGTVGVVMFRFLLLRKPPIFHFMLPLQDYQRYGRQMILDGIGLPGEFVTSASVTIFDGPLKVNSSSSLRLQ
jgi:hypothetical protein